MSDNYDGVDPNVWVLVASGSVGDQVIWESAFEAMGTVHALVPELERLGEKSFSWDDLLRDLPDLQILRSQEFPPLYLESGFADIDGFLTVDFETDDDGPGQSFAGVRIYVDREKLDRLRGQFEKLAQRMELLSRRGRPLTEEQLQDLADLY